MSFCKKCGVKVPSDAEFCPECGAKLVTAVPRQSPEVKEFDGKKIVQPTKIPRQPKRKGRWIIVSVLIIVVFLAIFLYTSLPQKGADKLTIASFNAEHVDENIPGLYLLINDYGVTGNTVWANGTVNWTGRSDYYITGVGGVGMAIKHHSPESVDINIFMWGGFLFWGTETIANDSVSLPDLGGAQTAYPQSFDFQLSANVPLPVPYSRE